VPPALAARPLPWLALTLAFGTWVGIAAATASSRVLVLVLVLGACVFAGRRAGWSLAALGLLCFARGFVAAPPIPDVETGAAALAAARDAPIVGRWRSEPRAGAGFVEAAGVAPSAGHRILFETGAKVPREGDWVALLPARAPSPWPRGPVGGPRARDRRFAAWSAVNPDELVRVPAPRSGAAWLARARSWIEGVRAGIRARTEKLESPLRARGLVRSLVLGERGELSPRVRDLFTRTGTAHLLAVSGFNVSLLFGMLGLFSLLPSEGPGRVRRRVLLAWILAALLFGYAWVVGGSAPVLRASTSLALSTFALVIPSPVSPFRPRRADALSLWSAALVIECLLSPRELAQASLQLSYLATLGILACTGPARRLVGLERLLSAPPPGLSLAATAARILAQRFLRVAALSVAASIAATLFTLPVVWARFGEVAPAGVLVTPIVAPLLALLLVLSWIGVFLPSLGLGPLAAWLAERFVDLLELADALPGTPTPLPLRPLALVALAVGLVARWLLRREAGASGRAACLACGLLLVPWSLAPVELELHALDVGHGSAFVLRAPGLPALLFDAGSRNRREVYEEALAPLLARWEVARPWIVLSHGDADHLTAFPRLVERYPPELWVGDVPPDLAARLPHDVRLVDSGGGTLAIPRTARAAPLALRLLRASADPGNEGSRSLEVAWGSERLILFGDAEADGLEALLRGGSIEGPFRLVVLPHHGSESALLGDLLDATRPAEAWVSSSELPPAAGELARRGISWRCTADGPLALVLPWPAPADPPTSSSVDGIVKDGSAASFSRNRAPTTR
jgi:competence protein ComEC